MAKEPSKSESEEAKEERGKQPLASVQQSVSALRQEMDRVFDDFARHWTVSPFYRRFFDWEPFRRMERASGVLMPETDVVEGEDAIRVSVELPGMEEKDIEVEVTEDTLTISGEKRDEREEEDEDYHLSERSYGAFKRTLRVPDTVASSNVSAEMKNGILTVTLPKTAKAKQKPKKVSVKKG
jgi:HSP20 family protein